MTRQMLVERKNMLEASMKELEQRYHIISGHVAELNYQLLNMTDEEAVPEENPDIVDIKQDCIEVETVV